MISPSVLRLIDAFSPVVASNFARTASHHSSSKEQFTTTACARAGTPAATDPSRIVEKRNALALIVRPPRLGPGTRDVFTLLAFW